MNKKGQQWVAASDKIIAAFNAIKECGDIRTIEAALRNLLIRVSCNHDGVSSRELSRVGEAVRILILEHGARIGTKLWMPGARDPKEVSQRL